MLVPEVFVLCLQIGSRSSVYSPESSVRKTGSYIYEEFMPTDGTDVKVRRSLGELHVGRSCLVPQRFWRVVLSCEVLTVQLDPGAGAGVLHVITGGMCETVDVLLSVSAVEIPSGSCSQSEWLCQVYLFLLPGVHCWARLCPCRGSQIPRFGWEG